MCRVQLWAWDMWDVWHVVCGVCGMWYGMWGVWGAAWDWAGQPQAPASGSSPVGVGQGTCWSLRLHSAQVGA